MAREIRELPKHQNAFEIYFAYLEEGLLHTQAIKKTAEDIGVTPRTVFRWSKKFNWEEKRIRKQAAIAREIEIQTTKNFAENRIKYLNILHKLLDNFVKKDLPVDVESMKDLDLVIKNCLILQEQPTEVVKTQNVNMDMKMNELFDDELLNEILDEDKDD